MAGTETPERHIIHIDMDAFFAAIEQRDNPALRGKPLIVGRLPDERGVVATCNYEARKFGIRSAMASSHAARLCPQAIFIPPCCDNYRGVSQELRAIFLEFSDLVEMVSLDEAYIDVSKYCSDIADACNIARLIKARIKKVTTLTASAGVANNKLLAKLASDMDKPDGLYFIPLDKVEDFIAATPVSRFHGIGKVTATQMQAMGITTGADLRKVSEDDLVAKFGKVGSYYYGVARGRDDRPIIVDRVRKSLGAERTYAHDLFDKDEILEEIKLRAVNVARMLVKKGGSARTITLKVKYANFQLITRSHTLDAPLSGLKEMQAALSELMTKTEIGKRKVRLLGVSVSNFCESPSQDSKDGKDGKDDQNDRFLHTQQPTLGFLGTDSEVQEGDTR